MAKCIKKGSKIVRVLEVEVEKFVKDGWTYTSKSSWKASGRN